LTAAWPNSDWDFTAAYWDKEMIEKDLPKLERVISASAVACSAERPSSTSDQRLSHWPALLDRPAICGLMGISRETSPGNALAF
jgi:hypothetical protein